MTDDRDETNPEHSVPEAGPEPSPDAEPTAAEPLPVEAPPGADSDGDAELEEALPLVEALLFASSKPIALDKLAEAAELSEEVVVRALEALEAACAAAGRGVRLDRVAGGVRLVSRPEYDYPVRRLLGLDGKTKLSMAALETLAIVAYRQPVTGPEIAELRAVNSSSSIRTLLDRKLITTAGRKEVVGTPFLYKTTKEFLVHFGLKGLGDLPKPEELEAIYGLEAPKADPAQVELFHVDEATGEVEEIEEGGPEDTSPAEDAQTRTDQELPAPERAPAEAEPAEEAGPVPGEETARGEERHDG